MAGGETRFLPVTGLCHERVETPLHLFDLLSLADDQLGNEADQDQEQTGQGESAGGPEDRALLGLRQQIKQE